MSGFSLAWRSVIRKPVKSILLFVTVFIVNDINIFYLLFRYTLVK